MIKVRLFCSVVALVTVSVNLIYGNLILVIITSRGKLIYNCPCCLRMFTQKCWLISKSEYKVLIMNVFWKELILSRVEIKVCVRKGKFPLSAITRAFRKLSNYFCCRKLLDKSNYGCSSVQNLYYLFIYALYQIFALIRYT